MDLFYRTTRRRLQQLQAELQAHGRQGRQGGARGQQGEGERAGPGPGTVRDAARVHFHEFMQGSLPLGDWSVGPGADEALRTAWQRHLEAAGRHGGGGGVSRTGASRVIRGGGGGGGGSSSSSPGGGAPGEMDDDTGNSSIAEVPLAYGRWLKVPNTCGSAAFFSFSQLCGASGLKAGVDDGGALAAPDYLALCRHFNELYITDVPQLGLTQRDEARRLVTLLDVAYDMK
eukprot:XP_001700797.1 predicted protein [Chlamydomonas reinhardtii]